MTEKCKELIKGIAKDTNQVKELGRQLPITQAIVDEWNRNPAHRMQVHKESERQRIDHERKALADAADGLIDQYHREHHIESNLMSGASGGAAALAKKLSKVLHKQVAQSA